MTFASPLIMLDDHITFYIVNVVFREWHRSAQPNISNVSNKNNNLETTTLTPMPVQTTHAGLIALLQKCVQAGQYSYIVLGDRVTYK